MKKMHQIHDFAVKWINKFRDENIHCDELADRQLPYFEGAAQKIRIVSNRLGYGPIPEADEEVEQHITLNAKGRVWFSAYHFGSGDGAYKIFRTKQYKIDQDTAAKVLFGIAAYFSCTHPEFFVSDIGEWSMDITNTEGNVYKFRGSLCSDFVVDGLDLSDMVREALGMDDLYVFDGNDKPNRVDRVTIDYHCIKKNKPEPPAADSTEYMTQDYTEKLVLDRKSETLEHTQNFNSRSLVSRKYCVQGDIGELLDAIDPDDLFGEIEGNPDDIVDIPLESKAYTITVDCRKGPQRVIRGTYNKKGLPKSWSDFADAVRQFICLHCLHASFDILNPALYDTVNYCKQDYIYCSVEFKAGGKGYYYIADDDTISVDDYVVVPVGMDDRHIVARVVQVEFFAEEDVPLPLDLTKYIIRKCTDEHLEPPEA